MHEDDLRTTEELRQADQQSDATAGRRMSIAALVITVFLSVGKLMGYVKEMLIASLGASSSTDAFKVAYNSVIFTIYTKVEKTLRPTYLPQFVKVRREDGEQPAWELASAMTGFQFLVLGALALICVVFAEPILLFVGKGLANDPAALHRGVVVLRIMAPALLLFSLSVMPELTLHAYKRFSLPAIAEASFRFAVVVISFMLLYLVWPYRVDADPHRPDEAIYAFAFGVMAGGCLRLLVQIPGLWNHLHRFRLTANVFRNPNAWKVITLMPPVLIGVAFSTLRTWADSRFGTDIGSGVYTCLDFGRKITDLFLQTLPLAVSFVVYPYLSEWALRGEKDKMADALVATTRAMAFVYVPVSVVLMVASLPIIRLVFQAGEFTAEHARLSAMGVYWYAPGMFFYSVEGSINHWFFAYQDTMTPNIVGALFAILHVVIGYLGVYVFGATPGAKLSWVAAALTISKSTKVIALYVLIRRRIGHIDVAKQVRFTLQLAVCVGLMGLVLYLLEQQMAPVLEGWDGGLKIKAAAHMGSSFVVGALVFLGCAALLRINEISLVWDAARKVGRKINARLKSGRGQ
ncbi:MAG: oligosaccharide flippase family protein [Armatimonadetes bacterium]|nr:oligosaccharide flippase family protein [Armatimonadota bacterium]